MLLLNCSGGSGDVVVFGNLRFWAERGLIHIEDARDSSYQTVSVREAADRAQAISAMLGNSTARERNSEDQFDQAMRKQNQDMVDGLVDVLRKAQIQGMPDDPSAIRDLKRRAKRSIVVPGNNGW